jgi:hypothetical protein
MEPKPLQILKDGSLGSRAHPGSVQIIDSNQPHPPSPANLQPAQQGRAQIAEMEFAAGRGGKASANAKLSQADTLDKTFP